MHQIAILSVQFFKHRLDSELLVGPGGQFFHLDLALLELLGEFGLRGQQHQKRVAFRLVASCATHTMDVCIGILRAIDLDDPVNSGEIDTTRRYICTEQHGVFFLHELKVDSRSLILVLLPVQFE